MVDGQQRLVTIFEFFDNELPLAEEAAQKFGGVYYKDLSDKYTDVFDDFEIEFDEIEHASDEEVKRFFQRLQDGLPLTSSEKLNSVHSKLRDFLMKKTKHKLFEKVNASDKRYGHFDILVKTAAIEIDGIDVGLRYDDLRAVLESQAAFSGRSNVAKRIAGALDFVHQGFTLQDLAVLRNRTVVQSLLTLVCRLLQSGKQKGREKRVAAFFMHFLKELNKQVELGQKATDLEYLHFQRTVNANIRGGARIRQEILLRKLLSYDPGFAAMFGPAELVESGINATVKSDGAEVVGLFVDANTKYSATHGEDLFKATNKTVQAQGRIAIPFLDYQGYMRFIDDLYFLVHEGIGDRLQGNVPGSFKDVNTLRTELRHDVDHGSKRKVRATRKKGGKTFKRYSGAPSPAGLAPERFVIVQANMLAELKKDLRRLVHAL